MYAGVKKGNPMMWSQCTCDMNTWNVFGRAGPCRASTEIPKGRTPLPRSHSTYSPPPVSISTQEEFPPNVRATAKSSSCSTKRCAFSGVSSPRPAALTSAATSLRWMAAAVGATGMEPRVPQKRTSIRPAPRRRRRRGRPARGPPARPGRTERR